MSPQAAAWRKSSFKKKKKVPAPNPLIDQTGNQLRDRPYISVRRTVLHLTTTLVRAFFNKADPLEFALAYFQDGP